MTEEAVPAARSAFGHGKERMIPNMNVSNVGRQCKRKPRLPVLFRNKNGTKEPSPRIRGVAFLLVILLVANIFALPCSAASSQYQIQLTEVTNNQVIGKLEQQNVYYASISSQYDSLKIIEGGDRTALSADSWTGQSYYSVGNQNIERTNGYYEAMRSALRQLC